jgi:hypothetical protein
LKVKAEAENEEVKYREITIHIHSVMPCLNEFSILEDLFLNN